MPGDGSWFDDVFSMVASPLHVEFFGTSISVSYTPPQPAASTVALANVRISDEITEQNKTEFSVELETVRYLAAIVNSGHAKYCNVANFQQNGVVQIGGAKYVITKINRHAGDEQELRLSNLEPVHIGPPDR